MLQVKNLVKNYGSVMVLKGINFSIGAGTVFGFLGPNGAGKSTTMNVLTGLIDFQDGQVLIDGLDLRKNKDALRQRIGYLPENPVYYGYMNAPEYLRMIGDLSCYPQKEISKRIDELLELVQLTDVTRRRIGKYSRGMKQRLGLAVALFNHPQYLFLDEPTSALDPQGRMDMLNLVEQLKNLEITVFLSTHILADVERVCDRVSILHQGEIRLTEDMNELRQKFIQPIFDLEVTGQLDAILTKFSGLDWVQDVKVEDSQLSVYVSDPEMAKYKLPEVIADFNLGLVSYKIRQITLEDIFVRMVKI